MTKPIIKFYDVTTQEETIREMNDEEFSQYKVDKIKWDSEEAAQQEVTND